MYMCVYLKQKVQYINNSKTKSILHIWMEYHVIVFFSDILLEQWRLNGTLNSLLWNHVKAVLLKRHKHQHVGRRQIKRHQSRASNLFQGAFLSDEEDVPSSPETRSRMNGLYCIVVNVEINLIYVTDGRKEL